MITRPAIPTVTTEPHQIAHYNANTVMPISQFIMISTTFVEHNQQTQTIIIIIIIIMAYI